VNSEDPYAATIYPECRVTRASTRRLGDVRSGVGIAGSVGEHPAETISGGGSPSETPAPSPSGVPVGAAVSSTDLTPIAIAIVIDAIVIGGGLAFGWRRQKKSS
jgi:hypothetical protein